jgi:DsbC/DsbD-like thiol-disulfide interchange protein
MTIAKTIIVLTCAALAHAADWSAPVEVEHDAHRVAAYRGKLTGDLLAVQVTLEPGWHTFSIDNERRAIEKLAGRKSLGIDQPTEIKLKQGLEIAGPWYQTVPKDFSKPELRWYAWGFEGQALFAAKVRRAGSGDVKLGIRGQACTETVCKNVDLELVLSGPSAAQSDIDLKDLVPVR